MYVKHEKTTNKEISAIHSAAFEPLTQLWEANQNYYNLKQMIHHKIEVPEFRLKAIED